MSREIKFRYRYTDGKNWIMKVFTLDQIVNGEPFEVLSDEPLLRNYRMVGQDQFTGLKDKNGTEIYEGDVILSRLAEDFPDAFVVEHDQCNPCFALQSLTNKHRREYDFIQCGLRKNEIIGNIFQHPNLLEVSNEQD